MKRNILRSFDDNTHLFGRIWGVVAAVLIIAFPFVCMAIFGWASTGRSSLPGSPSS